MTTDSKTRGFWTGGWTKGLAMLGLVVAGGLIEGCIIDSGGGGSCGPSQVAATWGVSANHVAISCAQAGATEVDFIVDTMEQPFSCDAHSGITDFLTAGSHNVSFELRDAAQNVLSSIGPIHRNIPCDSVADFGNIDFSLTP